MRIFMLFLIALLISVKSFAASRVVTSFRNVYSTTPVTTGAPILVVASLVNSIHQVSVFDSSGNTMKLTITNGANVDTLLIPPGGGDFLAGIPLGAQVQLQAVSANSTLGEIDIDFIY